MQLLFDDRAAGVNERLAVALQTLQDKTFTAKKASSPAAVKGNVHLARNSTKEAEESFQHALTLNPGFLRPYYSLAKIYLKTGRQEKAIAQYKTLIEKQPGQELPHMMLGTIYEMQKEYELSEHHYLEALKIKPGFAAAENNLAYLLASRDKDIDVALGYAQSAKEKLPEDPGVMDTIGLVYYKKQYTSCEPY